MTSETLEELRERLLRQHNVQQMIRVRAYEIYRMRGGQPGGEAQDWFHAESEVLAFLLADESGRVHEEAGSTSAERAPSAAVEAPAVKKPRSRAGAKPAAAQTAAPKKAAPKRATSRKSGESKSKSKRTSNQSKKEKSAD